jgi:C1A family cysteine protease
MKESRLGRKYGLIPSPESKADFLARDIGFPMAGYPAEWDLRPTSPVRDQLDQGSCTGFGTTAALEYKWKLNKLIFSPADQYWNELDIEHSTGVDNGAMIKDGMRAFLKRGCCLEVDDPYTDLSYKTPPTATAARDALAFRINSYHRLHTWAEYCAAIYAGFAVVWGGILFESFESDAVAKTGMVPMPKRGEEKLGGHCMCGFGYTPYHAIVKNSWNITWGDKGYCYIPKGYFTRSKVTDLWIIQ